MPFKNYVYVINFARDFASDFEYSLMKIYLMILKSKKIDFKFLLSHDINLRNMSANFLNDTHICFKIELTNM